MAADDITVDRPAEQFPVRLVQASQVKPQPAGRPRANLHGGEVTVVLAGSSRCSINAHLASLGGMPRWR
jgi:glycerate-2-kinase